MAKIQDERSLIDGVRAGNREALDALLGSVEGRVLRYAMRMCRDPEDAKDVLQDTLVEVTRSIGDFRGDAALSTWLFTVARSACAKKRRKSKFAPGELVSIDASASAAVRELASDERTPEVQASDRELGQAIEAAIGALEPGQREVLLLRDVEGLSAKEVASVMGLSPEAVKSRLHRARVEVRDAVLPLLGIEGATLSAHRNESCPDVLELFSKRLEGDIDPNVCGEMEAHLASCPKCEGACASLRETLLACKSSRTPEVPEKLKKSIRLAAGRFLSPKS